MAKATGRLTYLIARLRRILFWLFGGLLAACLIACALIWNAARRFSPADLYALTASAVKTQTGLDLVAGGTSIVYGFHLHVRFQPARLLRANQEVARFEAISLSLGYRTLLFHGGLPILSVTLVHPVLIRDRSLFMPAALQVGSSYPAPTRVAGDSRAGETPAATSEIAAPVLDAAAIGALRLALVQAGNLTREVIVSKAVIEDREGHVLLDQADLRVTHRRAFASAWQSRLEAYFRGGSVPSFRFGATLMLAPDMDGPEVPFARGSLWLWDAALDGIGIGGFTVKGRLQGNATLQVRSDGVVQGQATARVADFQLAGDRLQSPVAPGILNLDGRVSLSRQTLEFNPISLRVAGQEPLSGSVALRQALTGNPQLVANLSPIRLSAAQVKSALSRLRGLPSWLTAGARLVSSADLAIEQLAVNSPLHDLVAPGPRLLQQISMSANLQDTALDPPGTPPFSELEAKLIYANGRLQWTQSHANFGRSTLSEIQLTCDLSRGTEMPYEARLAGELDLGELFPLTAKLQSTTLWPHLKNVHAVSGTTQATIEWHGDLNDFAPAAPTSYQAALRPAKITVEPARALSKFTLLGGSITLRPNDILLDHVDVTPAHGRATVTGRIERIAPAKLEVQDLALELHQVQSEDWVPNLLSPDTLTIRAAAGGNLRITRVKYGPHRYTINGDLTLGPGEIRFGFLRSPVIITNAASLKLEGDGGKLVMRGSRFEDAPLDMTVSIADFYDPTVRIDALAQRLDLEGIKAIQLPWSPKTPFKMDNTKFAGRVRAHQGILGRLLMKDLQGDFSRDRDNWKVYDITAETLGGQLKAEFGGRGSDDWMHMKIGLSDVNVAELQALQDAAQPALTGKLKSDADLWADTGSDFFDTLAGTTSVTVSDGVLRRFKVLSRMLNLVNVSQWLSAQVPDPRVAGVPFKTITAQFAGRQGIFETDDFMLDGPVMKITAGGHVDLATQKLNMQIGMRPFQLLDTVFNKIPLIGSRLADSQSGVVSAYFYVHGPVGNPSVTPAPITSVGHMLINTLGIPINLIRPQTVR